LNFAVSILCLIVLLGIYETVRGVITFKKGKKWTLVTKDFVAAAIIAGVVILVLYAWRQYEIARLAQ
jgi:hypothetical protein